MWEWWIGREVGGGGVVGCGNGERERCGLGGAVGYGSFGMVGCEVVK